MISAPCRAFKSRTILAKEHLIRNMMQVSEFAKVIVVACSESVENAVKEHQLQSRIKRYNAE